jgi:hypothetical protein
MQLWIIKWDENNTKYVVAVLKYFKLLSLQLSEENEENIW